MNRKLLLLAMASTLAIVACKPEAPAETAAPAVPAEQAAAPAEPAAAAVESAPASSPADVPFDVKGFAGTFSGTDTKLTLNADGTYSLSGPGVGEGTWTAEEDGKRIRLDPNSKSEEDRLYAVTSNDQLDALAADGQSSLKRETTMR
jgi:copper homeostasis protein (lipoprotein)